MGAIVVTINPRKVVMKKNNGKKAQKKPYRAPKLTRYGSVRKLTKGSTSGALDDTLNSFV